MEQRVGAILRRAFEFSFLSDVPLFRSDTPENHLFANQLDHLLHLRRGGRDLLVIIECKGLAMTRSWLPRSGPPEPGRGWWVHYGSQAKDVKKQLLNQARALRQFLRAATDSEPDIEAWLVHETRGTAPIVEELAPNLLGRAFRLGDFRNIVSDLSATCESVPVHASPWLIELSRGQCAPGQAHPPLRDALRYIHHASQTLDSHVYGHFKPNPTRNQIAVTGAAGSGKSVFLAYLLCVLASDLLIELGGDGSMRLSHRPGSLPPALPPPDRRKICCFAMTAFQVEALRDFHLSFKRIYAATHAGGEPAMARVEFLRWSGEIPPDCNVLLIDEAQDLNETDQRCVASWFHEAGGGGFLAVALDRQQQLRASGARARIVEGLNFRGKTLQMRRGYRQPFPVTITGLALLYRWFSASGPMIRPERAELPLQSSKVPTFKGGVGFEVSRGLHSGECRISMRNDSHPGNNWRQTVDLFSSAGALRRMLIAQDVRKCDVLWLRFSQQDPDLPSLTLGRDFEFYQIDTQHASEFIDRNIKGLEFPIVVIEGTHAGIDATADPVDLWTARRQLYLCTSRAVGFLYVVLNEDPAHAPFRKEVEKLLDSLRRPHRGPHESGYTWRLSFRWRDRDVVPVSDYEDAIASEDDTL